MTPSMPQFGLLAFLVFLVLNMLSGGTTPPDRMPSWLQDLLLRAQGRLAAIRGRGGNRSGLLYRGAHEIQTDDRAGGGGLITCRRAINPSFKSVGEQLCTRNRDAQAR